MCTLHAVARAVVRDLVDLVELIDLGDLLALGGAMALAALLVAVPGCNRHARVIMTDGTVHRVELTHSTESTVYGIERSGAPLELPRDEIANVTHPGNVGTIAFGIPGALLAVLGGTLLYVSSELDESDPGAEEAELALTATAIPTLAGGIALLSGAIWYGIQGSRSADALVPGAASGEGTAMLVPVISQRPDGVTAGGVGVLGRW